VHAVDFPAARQNLTQVVQLTAQIPFALIQRIVRPEKGRQALAREGAPLGGQVAQQAAVRCDLKRGTGPSASVISGVPSSLISRMIR
jgi:hypothetical protein